MATHCILFGAHQMNDRVMAAWQRLRNDVKNTDYHAVFQYDNSRQDFDPTRFASPDEWYVFSRLRLARRYDMYSCAPEGRVYDGNTTFPLLLYYIDKPEFTYYWRVEYDVHYEGNWREFFDAFSHNDSDLLASTLFRPAVKPEWKWWSTLRKPWYHWRKLDVIRGFLAISRLSAAACTSLDHAYLNGWAGHDEVSVPTILRAKGLTLEDIGGDGAFVREGNINRFYTNTPEGMYLAPGTLVCPPATPTPLGITGKLYHPVK